MKKILILLEHNNINFNKNLLNTISSVYKISKIIDIIIIGYKINKIINLIKNINIFNKILIINSIKFIFNIPDIIINQLIQIYRNYKYICCNSNIYTKNIFPKLSGILNLNFISNVIYIKNYNIFKKIIYTGNIIILEKNINKKIIFSIKENYFKNIIKIKNKDYFKFNLIKYYNFIKKIKNYIFLFNNILKNNIPNLNFSKIVIAGGLGIKSKKDFNIIKKLAFKLNAAVGGTRSAIEAGYLSNNYQIGQSGVTIFPNIYIAIGISGAEQHIVGIKESKIIISINIDKKAPIFSISDYGIIGDYKKIIPEIINNL